LAGGRSPLEYARTILKVCQIYLRSPLPCAAGISGADLDRRITAIMARNDIQETDAGRKALLVTLLAVMILVPFVTGGLKSTPAAQLAQSLARVLVPLAPNYQVATAVSAIISARPVQDAKRQQQHKAVPDHASPIHGMALAPPAIEVSMPLIVIAAPQLDADPQASAGDPEIKVCRPPQSLPDSRLMGPPVCLPQRVWDQIRQQNLVLMPDGQTLVASFEKERTLKARICMYAGSAAASTLTNLAINCF
jgi:hypothetical protein